MRLDYGPVLESCKETVHIRKCEYYGRCLAKGHAFWKQGEVCVKPCYSNERVDKVEIHEFWKRSFVFQVGLYVQIQRCEFKALGKRIESTQRGSFFG